MNMTTLEMINGGEHIWSMSDLTQLTGALMVGGEVPDDKVAYGTVSVPEGVMDKVAWLRQRGVSVLKWQADDLYLNAFDVGCEITGSMRTGNFHTKIDNVFDFIGFPKKEAEKYWGWYHLDSFEQRNITWEVSDPVYTKELTVL